MNVVSFCSCRTVDPLNKNNKVWQGGVEGGTSTDRHMMVKFDAGHGILEASR